MKTNNHQAQIIRELRGEKGKTQQERDTALRALAKARRAIDYKNKILGILRDDPHMVGLRSLIGEAIAKDAARQPEKDANNG